MKSAFSPHLQSLLREYDTSALQFSDGIVIERILMFGAMSDYYELKKQVGKQTIIDFFASHRTKFDKKTVKFRETLFELPHLSSQYPSIYEQMNKPLFRRSIR